MFVRGKLVNLPYIIKRRPIEKHRIPVRRRRFDASCGERGSLCPVNIVSHPGQKSRGRDQSNSRQIRGSQAISSESFGESGGKQCHPVSCKAEQVLIESHQSIIMSPHGTGPSSVRDLGPGLFEIPTHA